MSRLKELNDLINGIASEKDAMALVGKTCPNQVEDMSKASYGVAAGVKNCALIAEFIITYYTRGKCDYNKLVMSNTKFDPKAPKIVEFSLKGMLSKDPQVMLCEFGGHNATIIREGKTYALFQAWDGEYHVFPKLNPAGKSYNIFGTGDATIELIDKEANQLQVKNWPLKVTIVP